eukprot:COSAG06_NODE_43755_length_369_cov_0.766667_1_plen_79_part_10
MVPVMLEGKGWRASGWLGLLTAGALWTSMTDVTEQGVLQLRNQIEQVVGSATEGEDEGTDLPAAPTSEVKEELERLRDT